MFLTSRRPAGGSSTLALRHKLLYDCTMEHTGLTEAERTPPLSHRGRIFRGMVGMGTVFAGVGVMLGGALGVASLVQGYDTDDMDFMVVAFFAWAVIAFGIGALYAGLLALVARGRAFHEVSIARAAAAGAVPGLIPAAFVFVGALIGDGSTRDALDPLVIFPPLSAALATVTLLIARKARH